ncbi:MAG: DNA recombination protein RmuC [Alphaproteobacteria bacterium]|nr:DNA recombination protein RmuC [Alphaproteobacteria bacterium]
MDLVSIALGFVSGLFIGWIARPQRNTNKLIQLETLIKQLKSENDGLRVKCEKLVADSAANAARVSELTNVRTNMLNDFRAVSVELLEKQKESVVGTQKTVLAPVQEEMQKLKAGFDKQIQEMLKNSTENKVSIDEQIKSMKEQSNKLQQEANNLANALRNKKTQGCWGETYLENVLQMLGFVENVDYTKEEFFHSEDGNIRPDFIVNLPNNKRIIIDSKVSLESYLNYENAQNDQEREKYADEFLRATEKHIDKLGAKDYQKKVKDSGLDYVFMFMPLESAYILAMRRKPELYAGAQKKNVALITSSLLFPILKTVEMLLKLDRQNKNISDVVEMVNKLYEKYTNFTASFASIGKSIEKAQEAYGEANKQLSTGNGNMSVWFEKIKKKSGITTNKNIALEYQDEE